MIEIFEIEPDQNLIVTEGADTFLLFPDTAGVLVSLKVAEELYEQLQRMSERGWV